MASMGADTIMHEVLETTEALRLFNEFKPQFNSRIEEEHMVTGLGYRFTDIVAPMKERTESHIVELSQDGFDWMIIACIVKSFTGSPSLSFINKIELADEILQPPVIGAADWEVVIGPFIPTGPSTWIQTFGSINKFDISHGLKQFVTSFPLTDRPELFVTHNNTDPITYKIGVSMGRGV